MLPKFLQSSLKTYKEDTNTIATWLASKAKQCGYPSELLSQSQALAPEILQPDQPQTSKCLKGNARKKARNAAQKDPEPASNEDKVPAEASYIIKVKDFTLLADCIASYDKPVVKVPHSLVSALDRAIDLRKQHNEWFKKPKESDKHSGEMSDTTEGHSYFLKILQQTREILKPRMQTDAMNDFLAKPKGDPERQKASELSNRFNDLHVHEPSQAFLEAPDVVPQPKPGLEPRYESETVHTLEEQYLAAHCLFQDIRNIRSFLCQLWKQYQQGLDIVAISVTTNTAIDFVRNLEHDYLLQFPEKSDYESIVDMFYKVQCVHRGQDPNHKQPGDPFNFAVYDLAQECLLSTYVIISSVQDVVSPGHLPVYKPNHFGRRNLSSDWASKSPREKFHDDKLVILEAFPDLMAMTMITSKAPLAEDELLRGFGDMAPGKAIPLWLVFSVQCFLDAQHELNHDISRPHTHLRNVANAQRASVQKNLEFHRSLRVDTWPRTNDFQFNEILRVIDEWGGTGRDR